MDNQFLPEFQHLHCEFLSELAEVASQFTVLNDQIRQAKAARKKSNRSEYRQYAINQNLLYNLSLIVTLNNCPAYAEMRFNQNLLVVIELTELVRPRIEEAIRVWALSPNYELLRDVDPVFFVLASLLAVHNGDSYRDIETALGLPDGGAVVRIGTHALEAALPPLQFPRTDEEWLHQAASARFRTGALNFGGALDVNIQQLFKGEDENNLLYVLAVMDGNGYYTYAHVEKGPVDYTDQDLLERSSLGRELAAAHRDRRAPVLNFAPVKFEFPLPDKGVNRHLINREIIPEAYLEQNPDPPADGQFGSVMPEHVAVSAKPQGNRLEDFMATEPLGQHVLAPMVIYADKRFELFPSDYLLFREPLTYRPANPVYNAMHEAGRSPIERRLFGRTADKCMVRGDRARINSHPNECIAMLTLKLWNYSQQWDWINMDNGMPPKNSARLDAFVNLFRPHRYVAMRNFTERHLPRGIPEDLQWRGSGQTPRDLIRSMMNRMYLDVLDRLQPVPAPDNKFDRDEGDE